MTKSCTSSASVCVGNQPTRPLKEPHNLLRGSCRHSLAHQTLNIMPPVYFPPPWLSLLSRQTYTLIKRVPINHGLDNSSLEGLHARSELRLNSLAETETVQPGYNRGTKLGVCVGIQWNERVATSRRGDLWDITKPIRHGQHTNQQQRRHPLAHPQGKKKNQGHSRSAMQPVLHT
ncbi:hypothetical protein BJX76DRAFT_94063 [Aspergillus varians]